MKNPPERLRLPTNRLKTTNKVSKKKQKTAVIQVKAENKKRNKLGPYQPYQFVFQVIQQMYNQRFKW